MNKLDSVRESGSSPLFCPDRMSPRYTEHFSIPPKYKKHRHFPHNKKWINVNQRKSSPAVTEK